MSERLYGIAEIAAELGVKRGTVGAWHRRGFLPEPTEMLSMGPAWTDAALAEWWEVGRARAARSRQVERAL